MSPSPALSGQFGLVPGDYTLTFYVPKGEAGRHVICVDDNQVPDTASIPVTVALVDNIYRVTPVGDANIRFQLLLEMSGPQRCTGRCWGRRATRSRVSSSRCHHPSIPIIPPRATPCCRA